ncbi:MAG TPA: hypothetical protein VFV41_12775 [Streptosporangiaceae bacterium]|nr:hypothetical protein [Streptosporangiaceae bacterium]
MFSNYMFSGLSWWQVVLVVVPLTLGRDRRGARRHGAANFQGLRLRRDIDQ